MMIVFPSKEDRYVTLRLMFTYIFHLMLVYKFAKLQSFRDIIQASFYHTFSQHFTPNGIPKDQTLGTYFSCYMKPSTKKLTS